MHGLWNGQRVQTMAEPKTSRNNASVGDFLAAIPNEARRADCEQLCELMSKIVGEPAAMWGTNIVGFGSYTYTYASGRTGDWPLIAFSPRKTDLTLYVMPGFDEIADDLAKLGPHKIGKSCLYVKRLADLDGKVLAKICRDSVRVMRKRYPAAKTKR